MQVDCARTRRPLIITIYEAKSKLCGHRFRWWQTLPIGCICPCVKLCPCCKVHTQQACLSCHRSKDRWGQPTTSYAKWFRLQCIGDGCLGRLICNIVSEDFARNFSSFRFEKSLRSVRDFTVATERKLLQVSDDMCIFHMLDIYDALYVFLQAHLYTCYVAVMSSRSNSFYLQELNF